MKFDEEGRILGTLGDLGGAAHPMVTSMREHKSWLYIGGILNNRIGRIRLEGADPDWTSWKSYWGGPGMSARISLLDRLLDPFRGKAVTIPPLDGAWRPDTRLDTARLVAALPEVDGLSSDAQGVIWASAGNGLFRLTEGKAELAEAFPARITALTGFEGGIALADGGLILRGEHGSRDLRQAFARPVSATALTAAGAGLFIAEGSASHRAGDWVPALMGKAQDGAVWRLDTGTGRAEQIASGLAWPAGLAQGQDGSLVISEAFGHRLTGLSAGVPKKMLDRIPGYPGRLSPAAGGGWWLAVFAPRNRLIELVLREDHFRADMLATIPQ